MLVAVPVNAMLMAVTPAEVRAAAVTLTPSVSPCTMRLMHVE